MGISLFVMSDEVVVTRKKGRTTIPVKLRVKYGIKEGTRLVVVDTRDGVAFKRAVSISDLAGSGAGHSTPEEMKRRLDTLRREDRYSRWQQPRLSTTPDSSSSTITEG